VAVINWNETVINNYNSTDHEEIEMNLCLWAQSCSWQQLHKWWKQPKRFSYIPQHWHVNKEHFTWEFCCARPEQVFVVGYCQRFAFQCTAWFNLAPLRRYMRRKDSFVLGVPTEDALWHKGAVTYSHMNVQLGTAQTSTARSRSRRRHLQTFG